MEEILQIEESNFVRFWIFNIMGKFVSELFHGGLIVFGACLDSFREKDYLGEKDNMT